MACISYLHFVAYDLFVFTYNPNTYRPIESSVSLVNDNDNENGA